MSLLDKIKNIFIDVWSEEDLEDNTTRLYQKINRDEYNPEVILDISEQKYIGNKISKLFNLPLKRIDNNIKKEDFSQKKILITDDRYNYNKYIETGKLLMEELGAYDFRMATFTLSNEDKMPEYFYTDRKIRLPYEK